MVITFSFSVLIQVRSFYSFLKRKITQISPFHQIPLPPPHFPRSIYPSKCSWDPQISLPASILTPEMHSRPENYPSREHFDPRNALGARKIPFPRALYPLKCSWDPQISLPASILTPEMHSRPENFPSREHFDPRNALETRKLPFPRSIYPSKCSWDPQISLSASTLPPQMLLSPTDFPPNPHSIPLSAHSGPRSGPLSAFLGLKCVHWSTVWTTVRTLPV